MAKAKIRESDLYAPVKSMLEAQGYEVKGEVGAADVVAVRGDEEPVIVEMKTGFSLALFHQAIDRLRVSDAVYVAVPLATGRTFLAALRRNMKLCRRLGIGLITVRLRDGFTEIHLDPGPYNPRKSPRRTARLLREFARLEGDPNTGGSIRGGLMTAYRQDALRCLVLLSENGPTKAAMVAEGSGVARARRLMADNHYGWFERVETGIYAVSPNGKQALGDYAAQVDLLCAAEPGVP